MKPYLYLGIDQTGAVNKHGQPRPLPACLINDQQVHLFYLKNLNKNEIFKNILFHHHLDHFHPNNMLIALDCVLGLPMDLDIPWKEVLRKVSQTSGYGKKVAQEFFYQLGQGQVLKREVEIRLKAQSVFEERPFQKNIQTGTFRLWKDLSYDQQSFYVPALELKQNNDQIPLVEGYPSWLWKKIFKVKNRSAQQLQSLIKENDLPLFWQDDHQRMVNKDPNLADAFILSLGIKIFREELSKIKIHQEGHILGSNF